jgi:phosphoserine phosphatase RsbU/P
MGIGTWTHAERSGEGSPKRRTIGVAIDSLVDGYQRTMFEAMARTARDGDTNLLVFVGGRLPSPLFDLINPGNVDALIVVGSTIAREVGPEGLARFCDRHRSFPVCCVGVPAPGLPELVPIGGPGVAAVVMHLMADHGRRRIAFVRGLGADGAERYEAFCQCLREFGVPLREELVVDGDYTYASGRDAVRVLCEQRRVSFDAVVAADDYMALGVVDALEERGFAVPQDIAVVGFDDVDEARHAVVPLTTVQQPIRELGRRSVQLMIRALAGEKVEHTAPIVCHPVKRRSCGCVIEAPFTRRPSSLTHQYPSAEAALVARRDLVLADMLRTAQEELGIAGFHWEETLFNAITDEMRGAPGNPFLSANEDLSRRVSGSSGDVSTWQRVLSTLRYHVLECIGGNADLRSATETAFNDAFLVSASVVAREEDKRSSALTEVLRAVIRTGNALVASHDPEQLVPVLIRQLDAVGIPSCYLATYEDESRDRARLLLGYDRDQPIRKASDPVCFPSDEIVPRGLFPTERPTVYALLPLTYDEAKLGFALFEYDRSDTILFEVLQEQLSGALFANRG